MLPLLKCNSKFSTVLFIFNRLYWFNSALKPYSFLEPFMDVLHVVVLSLKALSISTDLPDSIHCEIGDIYLLLLLFAVRVSIRSMPVQVTSRLIKIGLAWFVSIPD